MARPDTYVWRMSVKALGLYTIVLMLTGFLVCVVWSVVWDLERSTSTHCGRKTRNYLPTISSVIGGFEPQRFIWRMCIALHTAPRFLYTIWQCSYYCRLATSLPPSGIGSQLYCVLIKILTALHLAENMCLLVLSYVSSTENFPIHEMSFIGFLVCSGLYMMLNMFLVERFAQMCNGTSQMRRSLKYKKILFAMYIFGVISAVFFYIRHNDYCESGVYSAFAASEYIIVAANIFFNNVPFYWELGDYTLHLLSPKEPVAPVIINIEPTSLTSSAR